MCGILGSVNFTTVADSLKYIHHRGPDSSGACSFHINGHTIDFLHQRLSIIDISEAGNQPMFSHDNKGCIIFNGEIYNHITIRNKLKFIKFKGHSDTETILNLFRNTNISNALQELNGIFGLAYIDTEKNLLYLARDRFGVKPLYYFYETGRLIFSSELRPIKALIKPKIDKGTLFNSMRMRYTPSPLTFYQNISKVEPGQLITIDLNITNFSIQKEYFTNVPTNIGSIQGDYRKLVQTYGDLFEQAVERQLMSDVDIGMLLSGGVDSALVAAIAKNKSKNHIKAFTIGYGDQNYNIDEIAYARHTANTLGLEHYDTTISFTDFIKSIQRVVSIVEEPIGTTSIVPMYFLSKLAASHVKVVLSGQGADEPLGGYFKYKSLSFIEKVRSFRFIYKHISKTKLNSPKHENLRRLLTSLQSIDSVDAFIDFNAISSMRELSTIMNPSIVNQGIQSLHDTQHLLHDIWIQRMPKQSKIKDYFLYNDLRTSLADDLLMYTDKITMNFGLECRVPILDNYLIEFIESLHKKYKYNLREGKLIHKAFAKEYLPSDIINRKKLGFQSPARYWFKDHQHDIETILSSGNEFNKLFNLNAIKKILGEHSKQLNHEKIIFMLLSIYYLTEDSKQPIV